MRSKAFFRNPKTKIYLFIYTFLLTGIILLSSFIAYFNNIVNEYYSEFANLTFISKQDYSKEINENENVLRVESSVVVMPDFDYDVLKKIDNQTKSSDIAWDNFLIRDKYTSLFYIPTFSDNLAHGEIILGLPFDSLNDEQKENIKKIKNKNIGFILSNEEKINYKIKNVEDVALDRIIISKIDYEILSKKTIYFNTRVFINDYNKVDTVRNYLSSLSIEDEFGLVLSSRGDWTANQNLISIIGFMNIGIKFIILIMIAIFLTIFKNIMKEKKYDFFIECVIGFKKSNILLNIFLNFTLMLLYSVIFSIIISYFLILVFKIFNVVTLSLNFENTFISILIICFINLFCCVSYKFKKGL